MTKTTRPTVTHELPDLKTVHDLREAARLSGSHFFDAGTMRCFGSKLYEDAYPLPDSDGRAMLFLTSEQDRVPYRNERVWGGARRYTVRLAHYAERASGGLIIDAVGNLGDYATLRAARAHAAKAQRIDSPERRQMWEAHEEQYRQNQWGGVPFHPGTSPPTPEDQAKGGA